MMFFIVGLGLGTTNAQAQAIQAKPAVIVGNLWLLRDSLTSGFAESSFVYGTSTKPGFPLMGDWDGDGMRTPGIVYDGNKWFLRNSNSTGAADVQFTYGFKGGFPIVGDWDGDGDDTAGMADVNLPDGTIIDTCDPGFITWYLRDSNTSGVATNSFTFGCPGFPVVGDWDGDGDDTPGERQIDTHFWALNNELDSTFDPGVDVTLFYGTRHDFPIVGDWDGDGDDTPGVRQWNVWALRNSNTSGVADFSFAYGSGTHWPLVWGQAP